MRPTVKTRKQNVLICVEHSFRENIPLLPGVPTYLTTQTGRKAILKLDEAYTQTRNFEISNWTSQSIKSNLRFGNFGFEIRLRPISNLLPTGRMIHQVCYYPRRGGECVIQYVKRRKRLT